MSRARFVTSVLLVVFAAEFAGACSAEPRELPGKQRLTTFLNCPTPQFQQACDPDASGTEFTQCEGMCVANTTNPSGHLECVPIAQLGIPNLRGYLCGAVPCTQTCDTNGVCTATDAVDHVPCNANNANSKCGGECLSGVCTDIPLAQECPFARDNQASCVFHTCEPFNARACTDASLPDNVSCTGGMCDGCGVCNGPGTCGGSGGAGGVGGGGAAGVGGTAGSGGTTAGSGGTTAGATGIGGTTAGATGIGGSTGAMGGAPTGGSTGAMGGATTGGAAGFGAASGAGGTTSTGGSAGDGAAGTSGAAGGGGAAGASSGAGGVAAAGGSGGSSSGGVSGGGTAGEGGDGVGGEGAGAAGESGAGGEPSGGASGTMSGGTAGASGASSGGSGASGEGGEGDGGRRKEGFVVEGGGCDCRQAPGHSRASSAWLALLLSAGLVLRRRPGRRAA